MIFRKILQKLLKLDLILQIVNYKNRPFPKGKHKKVIGLMKNELGGKIISTLLDLEQKIIVT